MEIFNYQKFIGVIVFGYFAVKIYYNFLFENINIKNSNEELVDFSITIVFASIVYLLTNFENVMINPIIYYVGFLVGTQSVSFKKLFADSIKDSDLGNAIFYLIIIIYTIIFVYFYVIQNLGNSVINPLLIIISVISLIIGIILSTKKEITNDATSANVNNFIISKLNPNIGFFSFLGALLMIHSSGESIIVSFFQSILIGSFVSYFSYYKPEFIIEKNDKNMLKNVSLVDLRNALFSDEEDKDNLTPVNLKNLSNTIKTLSDSLTKNLYSVNANIKEIANHSVNVDSLKEQIKTNKIVSGLSYITILVCITIMYVHYASDLSSNSA
jgi:hypothetical protein